MPFLLAVSQDAINAGFLGLLVVMTVGWLAISAYVIWRSRG